MSSSFPLSTLSCLVAATLACACAEPEWLPNSDLADTTLELNSQYELSDLSELESMATMTRQELQSECAREQGLTTAKRIICNFENQAQYGQFVGNNNKEISYAVFPAEGPMHAAIVLVSGRTESMLKYAEMIYELQVLNPQLGYSIFVLDHRGQGFSQRLLADENLQGEALYASEQYQKGHVESFDDYVDDLSTFVDNVVKPERFPASFLYGHSMGGGIVTRYLETRESAFSAAILSSPMHGIQALEGAVGAANLLLAEALDATSFADPIGGGGYQYQSFSQLLDAGEVDLTNCAERHEFTEWARRSRAYAQVKLGGPTAGWVVQAHEATLDMLEDVGDIEIPVLLMQAEGEEIVSNSKQIAFCAGMGSLCAINKYLGADHEIAQELDVVRDKYMHRLISFVEEFVPNQQ